MLIRVVKEGSHTLLKKQHVKSFVGPVALNNVPMNFYNLCSVYNGIAGADLGFIKGGANSRY